MLEKHEKRELGVYKAVHRLEIALKELESQVTTVATVFTPILFSGEPTSDSSVLNKDHPGCALNRTLTQLAEQLDAINNTLKAIISRVDL